MELLAMLGLGKQIITWVTTQANLANQKGEISDAELQQIKDEAGVSDNAWDNAVEAARARLAAN